MRALNPLFLQDKGGKILPPSPKDPHEEVSELSPVSLHLHLKVAPGGGRELEACGHGLPEDSASDWGLVFLRVVFLLFFKTPVEMLAEMVDACSVAEGAQ